MALYCYRVFRRRRSSDERSADSGGSAAPADRQPRDGNPPFRVSDALLAECVAEETEGGVAGVEPPDADETEGDFAGAEPPDVSVPPDTAGRDAQAARIERTAEQLFPDRTVTAITVQSSRPGNATGFVCFADAPSVYVKTVQGGDRLSTETAATRFAAARTATPAVVAAETTVGLATTPAAGVAFTERWGDGRRKTLRAAGEAVGRLHTAQFDAPGVIVGGDAERLRVVSESWTETLATTLARREADWLPARFADYAGRLPQLVRTVDPTLGSVAPRLCHDDLTRSNVLVDPPGLIDFERALIGDPALDVVCAVTHLIDQPDVTRDQRQPLVAAFHDGYRQIAGTLPATLSSYRPLYRAVSSLLVLQAFDSLVAAVDEPAEAVERAVRATVERRLSRAREL